MKHVEQEWESYLKRVLPPDVSQVQRVECKRAFYAGAHAILSRLMWLADPGEEPTAADMQMMKDVAVELRTFGASGGRG